MPRVHQQVARKNYEAEGIKKGETYYWWKQRYGSKQRSKTYPRPSQLSSARYVVVLDAIDDAREMINSSDDVDDMRQALTDCAEVARECGGEYGESADSIESAFPNGSPTIDECREKQEALESFADALESVDLDETELDAAKEELENWPEENGETHDALEQAVEDKLQELRDEACSALDDFSL